MWRKGRSKAIVVELILEVSVGSQASRTWAVQRKRVLHLVFYAVALVLLWKERQQELLLSMMLPVSTLSVLHLLGSSQILK